VYCVDTGSHISIRTKSTNDNQLNATAKACGQTVNLYNLKLTSLKIKNILFSYYSYACDIPYSILGMDFILAHTTNIDFTTNKLYLNGGITLDLLLEDPMESFSSVNQLTNVQHVPESITLTQLVPAQVTEPIRQVLINNLMCDPNWVPTDEDFEKLYDEFPGLTDLSRFNKEPKHNTKHYIKTKGPPPKCKPRRLDAEKIAILKEVMNDLMEKGIVRRSKSNYAAPLVLVQVPGKKPRPCGDYSEINKQTEDDTYAMRHIHDLNAEAHGCICWGKLDLVKAYNQIIVAEEDIHKTAVATPIGTFEWLRLPFGLCTAAQTFQRFIDEVLQEVTNNFPYQDDVTVYTRNRRQHYEIMRQIFTKFDEYGVIINREKSVLISDKVSVLGYELSSEGLKPSPEKLEIIEQIGKPTTEAQLHNFVGVINYFNRCIPGCSLILAPLYKLFTKKKKCRKEIKWNDEADRAFIQAKKALNEICLAHPDYSAEISVMVDASDYGIGGVIQQLEGDTWRPIQYFARKMSDTEKRYSAFGRETLAAFATLKKFRHHIEGHKFTLFTDHKALVDAVEKPHLNEKRVLREQRQLEFLCSLVKEGRIKHIPGKQNVVADCLSRAVNNICFPAEVELLEVYKEQRADKELLAIQKDTFVTREISLPNGKFELIYNTERGYDRLCIPISKRREIFDKHHNLSHRGIKATKHYLAARYYWPDMNKQIEEWVRSCNACQLAKSGRKTCAPLGSFDAGLDRFHTIHIDIITMDHEINGYKNVLTMIDRTTSWPEAVPIHNCEAKTVAWVLVNHWVKNFGVPRNIVTDQGKQFEAELFTALCKLLNTKRCRTTGYHPQSNGKIERWHKTVKEALMATSPGDWYTALPLVLLSLRSTHKEDLNASPSNLVYGCNLTLPNELIVKPNEPNELPTDFAQKLGDVLNAVKSQKTKQHGSKNSYVPKDLMTATHVYMVKGQFSRKGPRNSGPHEVVKRGDKTFDIKIGNKVTTVSIDQLKNAVGGAENAQISKTVQLVQQAKQKDLIEISCRDKEVSRATKQKKSVEEKTANVPLAKSTKQRGRPKKQPNVNVDKGTNVINEPKTTLTRRVTRSSK